MNDNWDVIALRGLSAVGSHGVHDFERRGTQVFSADLRLYVDSRQAAATDSVLHTVDYSELAEDAVAILSGPPVYLLETLASNLADMALSYPMVQKVDVTVHKPMAPVRHKFEDVSVSVTRTREERQVVLEGLRILDEGTEADLGADQGHAAQEFPATGAIAHAGHRSPAVASPQEAPSHGAPAVHPVEPLPVKPLATRGLRRRGDGPIVLPRSFTDGSPIYRVVLALGSNRGDSLKTLSQAVDTLAHTPGFEVKKVSPIVRTEPVLEEGALPQADYLNAVLIGRTVLPPPVLLQTLQRIEQRFGRVRGRRWAARTLDIDIIDLEGMQLSTRDLVLPHPRAHERAFVLYPWSMIAADDVIPGRGRVADLLRAAPDMDGVLAVREQWLGDGGEVLPGSERILVERPQRSRVSAQSGLPSVEVRGEKLHLAPLTGDPIFQQVLDKELRDAQRRKIEAQERARQQELERKRQIEEARQIAEARKRAEARKAEQARELAAKKKAQERAEQRARLREQEKAQQEARQKAEQRAQEKARQQAQAKARQTPPVKESRAASRSPQTEPQPHLLARRARSAQQQTAPVAQPKPGAGTTVQPGQATTQVAQSKSDARTAVRQQASTPAPRARQAASAPAQPQRRRSAVPATDQSIAASPQAATPVRGVAVPSSAAQAPGGGLPDWRSAASARQPRVVEYGPAAAQGAPATEAVPATTGSVSAGGRRVTVRPTPTGSIPVAGARR